MNLITKVLAIVGAMSFIAIILTFFFMFVTEVNRGIELKEMIRNERF
jgi:hypothetical protein